MSESIKEIAMGIEKYSPERHRRMCHGLSEGVRGTSTEMKENTRRWRRSQLTFIQLRSPMMLHGSQSQASIPTWNFRMLITCHHSEHIVIYLNNKASLLYFIKNRGIYVTIHQGAKFCLLETLLFTFQIQ